MLNLFNANQLYQIKIEVNDYLTGLVRQEIIYCLVNSYPLYQLKYFEMMNFYIHPDIKKPEYFNDFSKLEKVSQIQCHNNLPSFKNDIYEGLKIMKDFYNEKQILNYNYVQGKISEIENNFLKALTFYEEGVKLKEEFSMLEMFRILVEPASAQKFSVFLYENN